MPLLEAPDFLNQLEKYYQKSRIGGPSSITLTVKPYDGRTKPDPRQSEKRKLSNKQRKIVGKRVAEPEEKHKLCLVRAKHGKKHISCVLHAKDVNRFHIQYMGLLKEHMNTLQKPAKARKPVHRANKAS